MLFFDKLWKWNFVPSIIIFAFNLAHVGHIPRSLRTKTLVCQESIFALVDPTRSIEQAKRTTRPGSKKIHCLSREINQKKK